MAKKRFIHQGFFGKRNIESVPKDKPIIYKIKSRKGENIYTGVAKRSRPEDRLKEHLRNGKDPIPGANSFSIKQKESIKSAKKEEQKIIRAEKPKYNKK